MRKKISAVINIMVRYAFDYDRRGDGRKMSESLPKILYSFSRLLPMVPDQSASSDFTRLLPRGVQRYEPGEST